MSSQSRFPACKASAVNPQRTLMPSLAFAYQNGLSDLLLYGKPVPSVTDPSSPASNFGRSDWPAIELLGYCFEVETPRQSIMYSPGNPIDLIFAFGQLIWFISGSDSLEWMEYYNPIARKYSHDGQRLCGAFGKRLFNFENHFNQITHISELLKHDKYTRRATALILTPSDNINYNREYPCALGVQYFLRNDHLYSITFMRAQQALTILPYDAFLFMTLQYIMAKELGVGLGSYLHFAGTYHIYKSEVKRSRKVLEKSVISIQLGEFDASKTAISELIALEQNIRHWACNGDIKALVKRVEDLNQGETLMHQAESVFLAYALWRCYQKAILEQLLAKYSSPWRETIAVSLDRKLVK